MTLFSKKGVYAQVMVFVGPFLNRSCDRAPRGSPLASPGHSHPVSRSTASPLGRHARRAKVFPTSLSSYLRSNSMVAATVNFDHVDEWRATPC